MFIPRYSIRTYFIATVLLAIFCVVLSYAIDGSLWAGGVSVAVIGAAGAFGVYALFFAIAWVFVEAFVIQYPLPQSPFVTDEPPKQIMPPVDM